MGDLRFGISSSVPKLRNLLEGLLLLYILICVSFIYVIIYLHI